MRSELERWFERGVAGIQTTHACACGGNGELCTYAVLKSPADTSTL